MFSPCQFVLHRVPLFRDDDCFVAVLDVVLGNLAFVDFSALSQEVSREALLPKSVGIDTNKLFSLTATQGAEGDADFKKCRIFKGFQNFSSMFFFAT